MGRKALYDSSWDRVAIREGKKGKSLTQIAAILNISKQTLYATIQREPTFLDAIEMSRVYAQQYFEDMYHEALIGERDVNPGLLIKAMQCRFPDTWHPGMNVNTTHNIEVKHNEALETVRSKIEAMATKHLPKPDDVD